jgi:hypothetical protein
MAFAFIALLALLIAGLAGAAQFERPAHAQGTASITIVKQGLLGTDAASFTEDMTPGGGTFSLTSAANTKTFSGLEAGTYHVTEDALDGYQLTGAGCALSSSRAAPGLATPAGNTLGITVADGQNLTCTFVNASTQVAQFDVTVSKTVDGEAPADGSYAFTATWTAANLNGGAETSGNFTLDSGNGFMAVTSDMDAGSDYAVVENGVPTECGPDTPVHLLGYSIGATPEAAAAAAPVAAASFTDLQSNEYVVVRNASCETAATGSITIVKEGLTGDAVADFSDDVPGASDTFQLSAADNSITFENLPAGTYHFTEAEMEGWKLVSTGCALTPKPLAPVAPGNTLEVILGDGENQTCTFTNEQTTSNISVQKYLDGATAADGTFGFTEDIAGASDTFELNSGNSFMHEASVATGSSYGLVESGIDGTCDEGDTYRLAGYSVGATLEEALAAAPTDSLDIASVSGDMVVIVWDQTCANIATITIAKNFEPDTAGAEAGFTSDVPGNSTFSVAEGTDQTFANLNAGVYTFTEDKSNDWMLSSIFCSGQSSPSNISINLGGGVLKVTVNPGDAITCTFTNIPNPNAQHGSLTIVKEWVGGDPAAAEFSASDNLGATGNAFTLDGTTTQIAFNDLSDANYVVDEGDLAGWTVSNIVCTGGTNSLWDTDFPTGVLSVDLMDGENLICTFTNTATAADTGSLTITKAWSGGDPVDTSFTSSSNLGQTGDAFTLTGAEPSLMVNGLAAGTYDVTEGALNGWTLSSIVCTGQTDPADITSDTTAGTLSVALEAGDDVVCTFTNTMNAPETGSLTITKAWDGGTATDTSFTSSANLGQTGDAFTLTGAAPSLMVDSLAAGTYTVTEDALDGWTLTGITCVGQTDPADITSDLATGALSVALEAGDDVVCTFTNTFTPTGTGSITITKVWSGAPGVDTSFTTSANLLVPGNTFTLMDNGTGGETHVFSALGTTTYMFTEDALDGWTLSNIFCSVPLGVNINLTDRSLSVDMTDGETITCTFTNTVNPGTSSNVSGFEAPLFPVTNVPGSTDTSTNNNNNTTNPSNSSVSNTSPTDNSSTNNNTSNTSTNNSGTVNTGNRGITSNESPNSSAPVGNTSTNTQGGVIQAAPQQSGAAAAVTPVAPSTGSGASNSDSDTSLAIYLAAAVAAGLAGASLFGMARKR